VSGWPKRCKLAHAFLWAYSYKRLELAKLLGQLGVFLTLSPSPTSASESPPACCLGVDVKVIQTPHSIFCMAIH
jgi:hypothetical protein